MLGHGNDEEEKTPRVVESLLGRHVQMTACGTHHTMALSSESTEITYLV
jgi:alpha-tubulin suppressor-like RCC1 family protein